MLSRPPAKVGRYAILEQLGSGAMGVVFAAYDPELDRKVAVKLLAPGRDTERARQQLLAEAQALAKLSHPNVVPVHDAGRHEGRVFLAMEYVRGQTLRQFIDTIDRSGPRSWRVVHDVLVGAGRGLAAAHAAGLVHRDFKPQNVLIGEDNRAMVVDFGLATSPVESSSDPDPASENTKPPTTDHHRGPVGTAAYMAPELWEGAPATVQSDLFAFGVMLYQMLTGRLPYRARTPAAYLQKLGAGPPTPVRNIRRDTPWNLMRLVQRCMEHDPAQRPASAAAAANLVAPLRSGRRRRLAVVGGAVALMGLGALLFRSKPTWIDYGLPDRLAEADLSAAVRAFDVGDDMAALHGCLAAIR